MISHGTGCYYASELNLIKVCLSINLSTGIMSVLLVANTVPVDALSEMIQDLMPSSSHCLMMLRSLRRRYNHTTILLILSSYSYFIISHFINMVINYLLNLWSQELAFHEEEEHRNKLVRAENENFKHAEASFLVSRRRIVFNYF